MISLKNSTNSSEHSLNDVLLNVSIMSAKTFDSPFSFFKSFMSNSTDSLSLYLNDLVLLSLGKIDWSKAPEIEPAPIVFPWKEISLCNIYFLLDLWNLYAAFIAPSTLSEPELQKKDLQRFF